MNSHSTLFVFSGYVFSREMMPVAAFFARQRWKVHVLLGYSGSASDSIAAQCEAVGIHVVRVPPQLSYGDPHSGNVRAVDDRETTPAPPRTEIKSTLVGFLSRLPRLMTLVTMSLQAWRVRRFTRALFETTRPDAVFGGPYHACCQVDNGIGWMSERTRTPYFCIPFSPYLGENYATGARFSNLSKGMLAEHLTRDYDLINRTLAVLFPTWTRTREAQTIFMYDPIWMLVGKLTGLLDKNPWQQPTDRFDRVFVTSNWSRQLLIDSSYPAEKIIVSGLPLLDPVFAGMLKPANRVRLLQALGQAVDARFVLVNIEPSAEHKYADWDDHWRRLDALMLALAASRYTVVLSLHPLCRIENYCFIEEKYGFVIARNLTIHELYPYSEYVISFPCSTNWLSQTFNKPLIIYDTFGMSRAGADRAALFRLPWARIVSDIAEITTAIREIEGELVDNDRVGVETPPPACGVIFEIVCRSVSASSSAVTTQAEPITSEPAVRRVIESR